MMETDRRRLEFGLATSYVNVTPRTTSVTGCRPGRPAFSSPTRAPRLRTRSALGQLRHPERAPATSAVPPGQTFRCVALSDARGRHRTHARQHDRRKNERSPRGGQSLLRCIEAFRPRRQEPSASCASRADRMRRGRWRKAGGRREVELQAHL